MVENGCVVGLWAEHDEFSVGVDPDAVARWPVEQVAIRADLLAAVPVRHGDGSGDHEPPVGGVAVVVFEAGEEGSEVGTCAQGEVLARQRARGVAEVRAVACVRPWRVDLDGEVVLGDVHDGSFARVGRCVQRSERASAEREETSETVGAGWWCGLGLEHAHLPHLVGHGVPGELVDRDDDVLGYVGLLTRRDREIAEVDEPVEREEPGGDLSGDRADRRGERAVERPVGARCGEQIVDPLVELRSRNPAVDRGRQEFGSRLAPEPERERTALDHHVVEDVVHCELGAERGIAKLVRFDAVDGRVECSHDVGELFDGFHEMPFVVTRSPGSSSAAMTVRRDNPCHNATVAELSTVRAAVERGDWRAAVDALDECGPAARTAEGLELRAQAEYGNGGFEASMTAWEDLHALLLAEGDIPGAAQAAAMTAMFLMMDTGLMSPVRGWVRRADRLLVGHDEVPAHAVLAVARGYERFMSGDMDAARGYAASAIELGERLGVESAVVIGRVCAARVRIYDGHVEEGLELLDEIAVDLMSGVVDPLTTGIMYCELICAAQGMALHDRASQWTDVMERWRHGVAIGAISGRCRVHRAELLRVSGPCDLAEVEALGACEELRPWMRREFGWPLVELGTIRLRRGDLEGAEDALLSAHARAWSPHPALALLRLEQGDADTAAAMIADAIAHPYSIPSKMRPPFGDLWLAPLLEAQAEIASATGDLDMARSAADALGRIADAFPSRLLAAGAVLARARAALIDGDHEEAIHHAKAAAAAWSDIGAPFESATARTVLAEARVRLGDHAGARMELSAAHAAFESFGAVLRAQQLADRLAEPIGPSTPRVATPPVGASRRATFRRDGDTRTLGFGRNDISMRDLKGLRYVERLLAQPGREIHVLDLVAVERGSLPSIRTIDHEGPSSRDQGRGLPTIDDAARVAYRRRLAEVDDDIDDATRMNDLGRLALAQRDREYLIAELASAAGFRGRTRETGGTSERARTSVTRSIRYSLDRMKHHHPALADHLGQAVHTGTYCVYHPDPLSPLVWEV